MIIISSLFFSVLELYRYRINDTLLELLRGFNYFDCTLLINNLQDLFDAVLDHFSHFSLRFPN